MNRTLTLFIAIIFVSFSIAPPTDLRAQCGILEFANAGLTLTASNDGTNNRSGLVYNPGAALYYSVNAGSSNYPVDTYDEDGNYLVSTPQGFDYRGAWWNPALNTFEGNGYGSLGIFIHTLTSGTSYPSGSGTTIFTADQPDIQSVGDLDYDANEIIYYYDGFIYRYDRADNSLQGTYAIQNLPVSIADINSNTVVYTGCPGHEIAVYDYVNQQVLFVNKATGEYSGACQLPNDAPQRNSFGMSYTNNFLWLFDNGVWKGYEVVDFNANTLGKKVMDAIQIAPNPVSDVLQVNLENSFHPLHIQLFDMQGQIHLNQAVTAHGIDLDMTSFATGTYVLKVQFEEGYTTQKVIKQ